MGLDSKVPRNWKQVNLGDLATIVMGQSPPGANVNGPVLGLPFLQGNAEFGHRHPKAVQWCNPPARVAKKGDLLISVRAPVGEMNEADQDYTIGRGLAAIRVPAGDKEFMWHAIQYARDQLARVSQGSTFDAINKDELAGFTLLLPPIGERTFISKILLSIDNVIEATRAVIEQTRRLKTALLQDLLTSGLPGRHRKFKNARWFGRIPTDWGVVQLGELTTLVTSGSRGWSKYLVDSGAFFIRSQNIGLGAILRDDVAYVDPPQDQEAERARIETGDLLISITGEPGNVAWANEDLGEAYVSQHVALVRLKNPALSPWITLALSSSAGQIQFRSKMYGQTRPGLNLDNIEELVVPLPSANERTNCRELVEAVENRLSANTQQLKQLERCKATLSQGLLTGRIPVNTTNKEVA